MNLKSNEEKRKIVEHATTNSRSCTTLFNSLL